jgi:hypothetical protein
MPIVRVLSFADFSEKTFTDQEYADPAPEGFYYIQQHPNPSGASTSYT